MCELCWVVSKRVVGPELVQGILEGVDAWGLDDLSRELVPLVDDSEAEAVDPLCCHYSRLQDL